MTYDVLGCSREFDRYKLLELEGSEALLPEA